MNKITTRLENRELKAETLVSLFDINHECNVQMESVFFRNSSEDLMNVEQFDDQTTLFLSRDSIYHLLPEKLFFKENTLKDTGKRFFDFASEYEELLRKRREILSFFQPFDTTFFKLSLLVEQKLNFLSETGNYFFNTFFLDEEKPDSKKHDFDVYVAKIKLLLPFVSQIRGNFPLLADLIKEILEVDKVEVQEIVPLKKRFVIHKVGLTKDEYLTMNKELLSLFIFLQHWFLPLEMECDFRIKDFQQTFSFGESLILDYNTNL
jgi:hypothetical protein